MTWHDDEGHDAAALAEIELCSELIIAASRSDGPMTLAEIDAVLGLRCAHGTDAASTAPRA